MGHDSAWSKEGKGGNSSQNGARFRMEQRRGGGVTLPSGFAGILDSFRVDLDFFAGKLDLFRVDLDFFCRHFRLISCEFYGYLGLRSFSWT